MFFIISLSNIFIFGFVGLIKNMAFLSISNIRFQSINMNFFLVIHVLEKLFKASIFIFFLLPNINFLKNI